jgi:hypothetical protein
VPKVQQNGISDSWDSGNPGVSGNLAENPGTPGGEEGTGGGKAIPGRNWLFRGRIRGRWGGPQDGGEGGILNTTLIGADVQVGLQNGGAFGLKSPVLEA